MTLEQAKKRIEELERKVKELEARPATQHWHYHYPPQPYYPSYPNYQPWPTVPLGPTWICGVASNLVQGGGHFE